MKLLEPIQLGALTLPNRMVMAPLTRNRAYETVPGPLNATYYAQRATAGLIITEATQADPLGQGYPDTPGVHSVEQIAGWRAVTDAVHGAGGRIFLQMWHVGRISHPTVIGIQPVAPSALRPAGEIFTGKGTEPFETPRALTTEEVGGIIDQFHRGAENARRAGFDGVEVHGANGYLLDQFLESGTNHRTDAYGGAVENRIRLLREVVEAVVGVWGADRVGVRLSPGGTFNDMSDANPVETFTAAARALNPFGLAYLHVIESALGDASAWREGRPMGATELMRGTFDGKIISAGGYTRETAEAALQAGLADLIAFGRLFIANPNLVERFTAGLPLNEPDQTTFYGGDAHGYTDYPTATAVPVNA